MEVYVSLDQTTLTIDHESVVTLVRDFISFYEIKFDEASVHFVDVKTICDLHARFFDDPTPTDCISFPMDDSTDEGYRVLGEIFVCPEVALDYVNSHGGDPYHEVTLYTIHGLLHLIGFDDIDEVDRQEMRTEEARYLKHIATKMLWLNP